MLDGLDSDSEKIWDMRKLNLSEDTSYISSIDDYKSKISENKNNELQDENMNQSSYVLEYSAGRPWRDLVFSHSIKTYFPFLPSALLIPSEGRQFMNEKLYNYYKAVTACLNGRATHSQEKLIDMTESILNVDREVSETYNMDSKFFFNVFETSIADNNCISIPGIKQIVLITRNEDEVSAAIQLLKGPMNDLSSTEVGVAVQYETSSTYTGNLVSLCLCTDWVIIILVENALDSSDLSLLLLDSNIVKVVYQASHVQEALAARPIINIWDIKACAIEFHVESNVSLATLSTSFQPNINENMNSNYKLTVIPIHKYNCVALQKVDINKNDSILIKSLLAWSQLFKSKEKMKISSTWEENIFILGQVRTLPSIFRNQLKSILSHEVLNLESIFCCKDSLRYLAEMNLDVK